MTRRARKLWKWVSTGVFVLLLAVWLGSGRWALDWVGRRTTVVVWAGTLGVYDTIPGSQYGLTVRDLSGQSDYGLVWSEWYYFRWPGLGLDSLFSLWPLCVWAAGPCYLLWRLDWSRRRADRLERGECPWCHYERRGLKAHAACPECGRSPAARGDMGVKD